MTGDKLDPDAAGQVLWHQEPSTPGARQPGSFTTKLLEAWDRADGPNAFKLSLMWPELARAILVYNTPNGPALLALASLNEGA